MYTCITTPARIIFFYITLFSTGLLLTPLFLLCALLPASIRYKNPVYFALSSWWNTWILTSAGIKLGIHAQKNHTLFFQEPAVIIANHPSTLDPSIIESILNNQRRMWVVKHEFIGIPIWGFILRRMHLLIARNNPKKAAIGLTQGIKKSAANKSHLIIFPEGTRTDNNKIYPFKKGFIAIAKTLKRPIICLGLFGSEHVLAKGQIFPKQWSTHLDLVISEKFHYTDYDSDEELLEAIERWYTEKHTLYNRTRSSRL